MQAKRLASISRELINEFLVGVTLAIHWNIVDSFSYLYTHVVTGIRIGPQQYLLVGSITAGDRTEQQVLPTNVHTTACLRIPYALKCIFGTITIRAVLVRREYTRTRSQVSTHTHILNRCLCRYHFSLLKILTGLFHDVCLSKTGFSFPSFLKRSCLVETNIMTEINKRCWSRFTVNVK